MNLNLFGGWGGIVSAFIEAVMFYAYTVLLLRVAGKRTTGKMTTFDFVSTVAMGSTIAGTVISRDVPLASGMAALTALVGMQWIVAFTASRNSRFESFITSTPRLLYSDSRFLTDNMLDERVSRSEVIAKIRESGHASPNSVRAVVMEVTGDLTVLSEEAPEGAEGVLESVQR